MTTESSQPHAGTRRVLAAGLAFCVALAASAAEADRVVVKGIPLEGKVKSITKQEIVMETVLGRGELAIAVEDIESIETTALFQVTHGDDLRTLGQVVGLTPEAIRLSVPGAEPVELAFSDVYTARRAPGPDANLYQKAKAELPYWSGNVDLTGFVEFGSADTFVLETALGVERKRGPHHTSARVSYLFDTEKVDGSWETFDNQIYGDFRQEYAFAPRWFAFGFADGEYDEAYRVSIRTMPTLGAGYELFESESASFRVDTGPTYFYERFFGGSTQQFVGIALGAESDWKLPILDATWHNRLDYRFSPADPGDDGFLRYEMETLVPIWESLSFKFTIVNEYDTRPAESAEKNDFEMLLGLSYLF